jgi:hypothetical protein
MYNTYDKPLAPYKTGNPICQNNAINMSLFSLCLRRVRGAILSNLEGCKNPYILGRDITE